MLVINALIGQRMNIELASHFLAALEPDSNNISGDQ